MWLWNSTPDSRQVWLASLDAVAALKPSTIIAGHKDPGAPDDNATRVLDQSRRYIEDFDQTVAHSSTPTEVIDVMLAKYPAYGNRYTPCSPRHPPSSPPNHGPRQAHRNYEHRVLPGGP